jgi:hypothetical protein
MMKPVDVPERIDEAVRGVVNELIAVLKPYDVEVGTYAVMMLVALVDQQIREQFGEEVLN